jgi:hypothetical protein
VANSGNIEKKRPSRMAAWGPQGNQAGDCRKSANADGLTRQQYIAIDQAAHSSFGRFFSAAQSRR